MLLHTLYIKFYSYDINASRNYYFPNSTNLLQFLSFPVFIAVGLRCIMGRGRAALRRGVGLNELLGAAL